MILYIHKPVAIFTALIASGNSAYSNSDPVHHHNSDSITPNMTGNLNGSNGSSISAYNNYDISQAGESIVDSSVYGSGVVSSIYYNLDDDSDISNTSSSRYSKLTNNTKQFTTPTLPVNIETIEEEGVLNGDNRSITENTTDHSAHHTDIPTGSYDVLPDVKYDGEEKIEEQVLESVNAFSGVSPEIVNNSGFVGRLRTNVESPRLTEMVLNQQGDYEKLYTRDDVRSALYSDFDDDAFHNARVGILVRLQKLEDERAIHMDPELDAEVAKFVLDYNISRGNSIRVKPLIELFSNPQLSKKTLKRPKKSGVPFNTTTRSKNLKDVS